MAQDFTGLDQFHTRQHLPVQHGPLAVVDQAVEQRGARRQAAAPLSEHQRCVLVAEQCGQARVGLAQRLFDRTMLQLHPQRQTVDEHAQGTISAFARHAAAQQHCAKGDFITPAEGP
ncbi:hypothetical protein D3C81_1914150 [compost metagenome]